MFIGRIFASDHKWSDICVKNSTWSSNFTKNLLKNLNNLKCYLLAFLDCKMEFLVSFIGFFSLPNLETPYLCTYDVINWVLSAVSIQHNIIDFISLPLGGKQGLKGLALKIEGSELDNFCHYNSLLSTPLAYWCHTLSNSLKISFQIWRTMW